MDNVEEILEALFIGIAVASVLLQTCRYRKAIELFTECLTFLKEHASKLETETLNRLSALVYWRLFNIYYHIGHYKNAFENREKANAIYHQMGGSESSAELFAKLRDERVPKTQDTPDNEEDEEINEVFLLARNSGDKEKEALVLHMLVDWAFSRFKYSKAKRLLERSAALWGEIGKREQESIALVRLGDLCKSDEEYEQAKKHFEKALLIAEEDGDTYMQGVATGKLGTLCNLRGDYAKARTLHKKALEISVKIGDKKGESVDHRNLADVLLNLGECKEAREGYLKGLALSKEIGDQGGEASAYSDLGDVHQRLKDFEMAEYYYKKAIEIYSETGDLDNENSEYSRLGVLYHFLCKDDLALKYHERSLVITKQIGDKRGEATQYCNLGDVYKNRGDYLMAKECCEKALAISKETNHIRGQAIDYGNLGTIYQHLGDYQAAYELHQKALDMNIRINHKEGMAANYDHLGLCCQHLGEYVKAKEFWKKGLDIARAIGDSKNVSNIIGSLASVEQTIGECKSAKAYYEEALHISKEAKDVRQEGVMTGNLGTVARSLGDIPKAKEYLGKSLQTMKQIGNRVGEGTALANLGELYSSLGEYCKAIEYYEEALAISRETNDEEGEMTTNNNLGSLYLLQKEFEKASDCFTKALSICKKMRDLRGESISYCNIATLCFVRNDIPKAFWFLSASIKTLEKMLVSLGESEYDKIGFADQHSDPYRLMVVVLLKLGSIDQALSVSELGRARSLAERMETQYSTQPLPGFDPHQWIDHKNVVQTKSCTCLSFFFFSENLFYLILKANRKVTYKEISVRRCLPEDSRPPGASIQSQLENMASECYREFSLLPGELCEDRSLLLGDEHSEVRSPTKSEQSPEAEQSPDACQIREQNKGGGPKKQTHLKVLYKVIIAPVADGLEGSEIIVVPDRSLYRVPFSALMNEKGEFLAEKFRIRYTPSLTTLKLIQDSPADYHSETGVLIVGDPDVGTVEHQGRHFSFLRLPCANQEVQMIGDILNVHPLTGKEATKQTVLQRIHSVGLIHIAAHGDADRGNIALAPSNREKDDFLLTMSDISKVQLRAKLVVLSCCHSGKGHIKAEGVVGIARAFLGSGARSVLASLWAVDDEATLQFMKQFYEHLVNGKSASESLHKTMAWMRGTPGCCEVRKWAPFVLIGDDVSFNFTK